MEICYIITFQWPMAKGMGMDTASGTFWTDETDRMPIVREAVKHASANRRVPADANIVFLSVERNQL